MRCPKCGHQLVRRFRIVERLGKRCWGWKDRQRIKTYVPLNVCLSCRISIEINKLPVPSKLVRKKLRRA